MQIRWYQNFFFIVDSDEENETNFPETQEVSFGRFILVTNVSPDGLHTEQSLDTIGFETGETRIEVLDMWTEVWVAKEPIQEIYLCGFCKKEFTNILDIGPHMKEIHKDEEVEKMLFKCIYCDDKSFEERADYDKHMIDAKHYEELAKCNVCGVNQQSGKIVEHMFISHDLAVCDCCDTYMLEAQVDLHKLLFHGVCRKCKCQAEILIESENVDKKAKQRQNCLCNGPKELKPKVRYSLENIYSQSQNNCYCH